MASGSWSAHLPLFTSPPETARQTEYLDLPLSPPSTRKVAWNFTRPHSPHEFDSATGAGGPVQAKPLLAASTTNVIEAMNATADGPSASTAFVTWRLGPGSLLLNGRNRTSARQRSSNATPSTNSSSPDAPQNTDNSHVSANRTPAGSQQQHQAHSSQQLTGVTPPSSTKQHPQSQTPSSMQQQPSSFLKLLRPIKTTTAPVPMVTPAPLPAAVVEAMQQTSSDASRLSPLSLGQLFSTPTFQEDQDLASCLSMADLAETPFAFAKAGEHGKGDAQHGLYRPLFRPVRPSSATQGEQPPLELPGPLPLDIQHPDEIAPLLPDSSSWHRFSSQHQHRQQRQEQQQESGEKSAAACGPAPAPESTAPIFIPRAQASRQSSCFIRPPQPIREQQSQQPGSQAADVDAAPQKLQRCLAQLFNATQRLRNPPPDAAPQPQRQQRRRQQQQQQQQQNQQDCVGPANMPRRELPPTCRSLLDAPDIPAIDPSHQDPAHQAIASSGSDMHRSQAACDTHSARWPDTMFHDPEARGWLGGPVGRGTVIGVTGPPVPDVTPGEAAAAAAVAAAPTAAATAAAAAAATTAIATPSVSKSRPKRMAAKMLERERERERTAAAGRSDDLTAGVAGGHESKAPQEGAGCATGGHKRQALAAGCACLNCGVQQTPQWRCGPQGPRTLCNACGVRYKKGLPLISKKQE